MSQAGAGARRERRGALAALARFAAVAALAAATAGAGGERLLGDRPQEWVIVLRPGADAGEASNWLERAGIPVVRRLPELRLLHVLLPRGARGDAQRERLRRQPWVLYLTDQAHPEPASGRADEIDETSASIHK